MLVFRDGRQAASTAALAARCHARLLALQRSPSPALALDALLCAGELECALADAGSSAAGAAVTDACAAALFAPPRPAELAAAWERFRQHELPPAVTTSPPEGFAYYALHPLAYADRVASLPLPTTVGVVGIRSIGTTLSAVVCAALGARAQRITVRPSGHPFDRRTELSATQRAWVRALLARDAAFVVVDEGPGLSGSSLLSVAEALVAAGVPSHQIRILCSTEPQPSSLRAPDAEARCARFAFQAVERAPRRPAGAALDLSGGRWREALLTAREWPESWSWFERAKFLPADRSTLFKFEGFGHYGDAPFARAAALADAGFSPRPLVREEGFVGYEFVPGTPAARHDLSPAVLTRIADYLAARTRLLPASSTTDLGQLTRWNFLEGVGHELPPQRFEVARPVIPDGRMQPHEWIHSADGRLMKVDAVSHGDDHFYPGATDIAWDVAGAIIEWEFDADARAHFLEHYRRAAGDDVAPRLASYLLAYSLFRLGYCRYAAEAMAATDEAPRLRAAEQRYRKIVESLAPASAQAA